MNRLSILKLVFLLGVICTEAQQQNNDCIENGGTCIRKNPKSEDCVGLPYVCGRGEVCCPMTSTKNVRVKPKVPSFQPRRVCSKNPKRCYEEGGRCIPTDSKECTSATYDSLCKGEGCSCCLGNGKCLCGEANLARIVGGEEVLSPHKYPWMVALTSPLFKFPSFCGGALINDRYVLTAAHCYYTDYPVFFKPEDIQLLLGSHHESVSADDAPGVTRLVNIEYFKIHENYNYHTNDGDIGLIKLKKPLDLTTFKEIRPICLPTNPDETYEGIDGIVVGWGIQDYEQIDSSPGVLYEVTVPILGTSCKGDVQAEYDITENMMCAGTKKGGKDACSGDSGGPLVVYKGGKYTVVGIVSFGIGCGKPHTPGVYTRVTMYLDWIKTNTADAKYCS